MMRSLFLSFEVVCFETVEILWRTKKINGQMILLIISNRFFQLVKITGSNYFKLTPPPFFRAK